MHRYTCIYGTVYLAPIQKVFWEGDLDVGRILRYNCQEGEDVTPWQHKSLLWLGSAQPGLAQLGQVWLGSGWLGLAWPGPGSGPTRPGSAQLSLARLASARPASARKGRSRSDSPWLSPSLKNSQIFSFRRCIPSSYQKQPTPYEKLQVF